MGTVLIQITDYLLTQSWQIAFLVVVIALVNIVLRSKSAHVRYLLWLIVLAKCLVPPMYNIPLAILPEENLTEPVSTSLPVEILPVDSEMVGTTLTEAPALPSVSFEMPPLTIAGESQTKIIIRQRLGLVWLLGAAVFILFNLLKALRAHYWLWRRRKLLPSGLKNDIENLFSDHAIKSLPNVWLVDGFSQPFVWGLLRGSIYLSVDFLDINKPEHQKNILGHEISHILRFDAAVNFLQVIAQSIFWFHPFVWWANKKMRAEREKCCDEMAIARFNTLPRDYSTAILEILEATNKSIQPIPSLAVAGPVKNIEERIKTMLRPGKRFYRRPSLLAATVVLFLAILTVPTALVLTARAGIKTGDSISIAEKTSGSEVSTPRLGDLLRTFQKPNPGERERFGYSISTFRKNVLVGAYSARAAYMFDGETGTLLQTFNNPSSAERDFFGWSVATVGKNVLVGAPFGDYTDSDSPGAAYLFEGTTGKLLYKFINPKPDNCSYFGRCVAGVNDKDILIGAYCDEINVEGAGAAYLFDGSTGKLLRTFQKPKRATFLGFNICCVTAVGENIFVGAPEDDTGAKNAGAVYMYDSKTGKLQHTFLNPTPDVNEIFGNFIAGADNKVLIAAGRATVDGKQAGAVYAFDIVTGKLLNTFENPKPSEEIDFGDVFGRCVAFVGNNVLIGASVDDNDEAGVKNAGAAYLYDGISGKLLYTFLKPSPPIGVDRFGVSVAALGNDILIGAYMDSTVARSAGTVYLFKGVD